RHNSGCNPAGRCGERRSVSEVFRHNTQIDEIPFRLSTHFRINLRNLFHLSKYINYSPCHISSFTIYISSQIRLTTNTPIVEKHIPRTYLSMPLMILNNLNTSSKQKYSFQISVTFHTFTKNPLTCLNHRKYSIN